MNIKYFICIRIYILLVLLQDKIKRKAEMIGGHLKTEEIQRKAKRRIKKMMMMTIITEEDF